MKVLIFNISTCRKEECILKKFKILSSKLIRSWILEIFINICMIKMRNLWIIISKKFGHSRENIKKIMTT